MYIYASCHYSSRHSLRKSFDHALGLTPPRPWRYLLPNMFVLSADNAETKVDNSGAGQLCRLPTHTRKQFNFIKVTYTEPWCFLPLVCWPCWLQWSWLKLLGWTFSARVPSNQTKKVFAFLYAIHSSSLIRTIRETLELDRRFAWIDDCRRPFGFPFFSFSSSAYYTSCNYCYPLITSFIAPYRSQINPDMGWISLHALMLCQ